MTEKSFSSYTVYKDIFDDFLQKEPNSAFYTQLNLIPDDIFCKVCIACHECFLNVTLVNVSHFQRLNWHLLLMVEQWECL